MTPAASFYSDFLNKAWNQFPIFRGISFPEQLISQGKSSLTLPVFQTLESFVSLLHRLYLNPRYQSHVMRNCDQKLAAFNPQNFGVFTTCDFFNTPDGLRLIEINTNGGGFIVAMLQHCLAVTHDTQDTCALIEKVKTMFLAEFKLATGNHTLRSVVILDEHPPSQKLYTEMLAFQRLFEGFGWACEICEPSALTYDSSKNLVTTPSGLVVDVIYNRHCDFFLEHPDLAEVKSAYLSRAICLTPHPHVYAHCAHKQRLIDFSQRTFLQSLSLSEDEIRLIQDVVPPSTHLQDLPLSEVHQHKASYFFKPLQAFGSKGVYSGKSISHKKIDEISTQPYVLQPLLTPQPVHIPGIEGPFKEEIRVFVYQGEVQLISAKLYKGQAFNMQTLGGGFAPITPPKAPS